jgi:hypothetical protein
LVNFAIIFSFDSTLRADSTGRFAAFDYSGIFHWPGALSAWTLALGSISAMRPRIRFLFDANDHRWVGFLRFAFMRICAISRVKSGCRASLEQGSQI